VIVVADADQLDADLAQGRLRCPHCGGRLRRWAHASARRIRLLDGSTRLLRPRRGRCAACGGTQVQLPGSCLPRRADAAEVIGAALVASAAGRGWRHIAAELGRPGSTVRAWLRRARGGHVDWLRRQGVEHAALLDPDVLNHTAPAHTELGEALTALAAAVVAWRRRFAGPVDAWTLIGVFTGGRLLTPVPAD
jgi:uncharacterized protein DUF6431